jgi:hypothetical protein
MVRSVVQKQSRTSFDVVLSELGKEAPLAGCLYVAAREARMRLRRQLTGSVDAPAAVQ